MSGDATDGGAGAASGGVGSPGDGAGPAGGGIAARPIRVMLVDDDPLVRSGLRMLFGGTEAIEVVAEADDGEGVLGKFDRHHPDVVLMDIRMQGLDGVSAAGLLARQPSPPAVLMLTTFSADELVLRAIRAGAAGFLLKDAPPAEIVRAIELVHAGDSMLSPTVTRQLIDRVAAEGKTGTPRADADTLLASLSPRELEVARAVGRGLSNADISAELHLSVATVKAHVSRLLEKLGVDNRVQVALLIRDASPARS
jgi:DNA-binding NarL/FixJ family response regulator